MSLRILLFWLTLVQLAVAAEVVESSNIREEDPKNYKQEANFSDTLDRVYRQIQLNNKITYAKFRDRCSDPRNLNFTKLDWRNTDLSNLNLMNADFSYCNMKKAIFYGSNLTNAKFSGADLTKVDFRHTDLTSSEFTGAILNGARLNGSIIHDIQYHKIKSAKGCPFEDRAFLSSAVAFEQELHDHIAQLSGTPQSITLKKNHTLKGIYQLLYNGLTMRQKKGISNTLIDFRNLRFIYDSNFRAEPVEDSYLYPLLQEFVRFLKAPHFQNLVAGVYPKYRQSLLVVKIKSQDPTFAAKRRSMSLEAPKLDLHGKIPLTIKRKWVVQFVKDAQTRGHPYVEIITGRGIHNPSGIIGVQWNLFKEVLESEDYRSYVNNIQSLNKNGGWKVNLKSLFMKKKSDNSMAIKKWGIREIRKEKSKVTLLMRKELRTQKYKLIFPVQSIITNQILRNKKHRKKNQSVFGKVVKQLKIQSNSAKAKKSSTSTQLSSVKKKQKK